MFVTIGIPFFNAGKYLEYSIKSVLSQTHTNWELILIDDGSTDDSLQIAHHYASLDNRIKVYSDGKNKKLAARLNEIVQLSKAEIIVRMDADDLMSMDRIEKQLNVLKNNPNIDLVSTGLYSVTNDLELIGVRWHNSSSISRLELFNKKGCGIVHASIVARKVFFLRNKYDESLKIAQDYDLWFRCANRNDLKVTFLQEPLYYYREEDNATYEKILRAYRNERVMYNKYASGTLKLKLIAKSYIKSFLVFGLKITGNIDYLLNRRSKNSEIDLTAYKDKMKYELNYILNYTKHEK